MGKEIYLSELYDKAVVQLTRNETEWKSLLSSMSRYYQYSFDNNVLIHMQRPDAGLLATMDVWNKSIGRWVNKGSKSIAVIDINSPKATLKYLFDIMDTHGDHESFRKVMSLVWELENQYKPSLLINFHEKYHTPTTDIETCLYDIVVKVTNVNLPKYMEGFTIRDESSILYAMPIEPVREEFMQLVMSSVGYIIFQKCGLLTDAFADDFSNISHYKSKELFMAMGACIIAIARPILREIRTEIETIKTERSNAYEDRTTYQPFLQQGRGRNAISESENITERTNQRNHAVRKFMERVHEGKSSQPIEPIDSGGNDQPEDTGGGRRSGEAQGTAHTGTSANRSDAAVRGYIDEGGTHGNDKQDSGGNSRTGSSNENQIKNEKSPLEESESSKGGFFDIPVSRSESDKFDREEIEDITDLFLTADDIEGNTKEWLYEIYHFFADDNPSKEAKTDIIRAFYHSVDTVYHTKTEDYLTVKGNKTGLSFIIGGQNFSVTYQEIVDKIERLILLGIYPYSNENSILDDYAIPDEEKFEADEVRDTEVKKAEDIYQMSLFETDYADSYECPVSDDSGGIVTEYSDIQEAVFKQQPMGKEEIITDKDTNTGGETFNNKFVHGISDYCYRPEHQLYEGGMKAKCRNNIAAIKLLKNLVQEGQPATAEEQITLAKYVGWGGLANALTPNDDGTAAGDIHFEKEFREIKSLLTEEEFLSAQESTTTAYYTEQMIAAQIYKALGNFGFREGNILDPAMGTGNFFSVLPESMSKAKLYGIELDTVTGAIAKLLYPTAEITVKGFEETKYPDQFFDAAIGNIPFNNLRLADARYDKYNPLIHDYFFMKTLDKVRNGGIIAFITTKGTMDKANPSVRKYIAQRAELIGAVRLPNTAFKKVAGTEVTADILFLQKREREIVPDEENSPWISVEKNQEGVPVNSYFIDRPEMLLGKMVYDESMYGNEKTTACIPVEGIDLEEALANAIGCLKAAYQEPISEFEEEKNNLADSVPADPAVRNFSYTVINEELYYREHSRMYKQDITGKKAERIKGILKIHSALRRIIDFQTDDYNREYLSQAEYETTLQGHISNLNSIYDEFTKEYGYLNANANIIAFAKDSSAPLLRSIEEERKKEKDVFDKTAVFYKATIHKRSLPKTADSAEETLKICLNTKGRIDIPYMASVYQMPDNRKVSEEEIIAELGDRIYLDPALYMEGNPYIGWVSAGEYLSGYVKDKLAEAVLMAEEYPELFQRNVDALKSVQPTPLTPQEISFTIGSTWIPAEIYEAFMYDTFKTSFYNKDSGNIGIEFSDYTGTYYIKNKSYENHSVTANQTFGTKRMNAYEILEITLNLRSAEVKDRVEYVDEQGEDKVKYVLNKTETILAREKQAEIKTAFENWLFAEANRSEELTKLYNDRFNNIRPREYSGTDLILSDIAEDITLRKHQLDVIAHGIYGEGNLLIAHEVGAGKTFSAGVISHEFKRLTNMQKPLIAVPNHLLGQWSKEYMRLYPNANILVAEKKDFEKKNRRRFVSRICTGDYDAIIMAHSSFELIGISREKQLSVLKEELDEIKNAIAEEKRNSGKKWSLKQMVMFEKNLQYRYDKLFNAEKKDDTIYFEELGVDALFVDEAHIYKNNFSYTKMRGVAGIGSTSSQRAMDMHMKCQYINEINNGKGVVYLTGTPISNSMSELYVIQKTLQPQELRRRGMLLFDAWASTFGKVETSLEIKPEGNGYQMKSRFAKFHNLPELMAMFHMIADIKTADMLDLPVPDLQTGAMQAIKTQITPAQKAFILEHGERAERIRKGEVDSTEDNFLKLTMEARLLSIDPRILDESIPYDPDTKLNECARKCAGIYHETMEKRLTQLIFCDVGTPKPDRFNFYDAIREELLKENVSENEIAFIHSFKTDLQREELFEKVRNGDVRILMGSTSKMGTGMNVQQKLFAIHNLDVPWRPADLTQRNGRGLRQGNENDEISIFNYMTEGTFDGYLWQILEQKQRYISQILTGRSALRSCEDIDDIMLQYAEFKALAVSDPRIKEKMETENEISRLQVLKSSWQTAKNEMQQDVITTYPNKIQDTAVLLEKTKIDKEYYEVHEPKEFKVTIANRTYDERSKAAEHFRILFGKLPFQDGERMEAGTYAGFTVSLKRVWGNGIELGLHGKRSYSVLLGDSELGAVTRMENLARSIPELYEELQRKLESLENQLTEAKEELKKPFVQEERLAELLKKKVELDLALEFGADSCIIGEEEGEADVKKQSPEQKLYNKLAVFAAPVLENRAYYMLLKSKGFEDLVIENIGDNEYSIAHYYEQNGDAMRDPEITFTVNKEIKSIAPTSYLQDNMGVFYTTENHTREQIEELERFMSEWFTNIKNQGFKPVTITSYEEESEEAEEEYEK